MILYINHNLSTGQGFMPLCPLSAIAADDYEYNTRRTSPVFRMASRRRKKRKRGHGDIPQNREYHNHANEEFDPRHPELKGRMRFPRRLAREPPGTCEYDERQRKHDQRVAAQRREDLAMKHVVKRP
jgi:hypothetical protein